MPIDPRAIAALFAAAALVAPAPASAQQSDDAAAATAAADGAATAAADDADAADLLYTDDELDALTAPLALFPDVLLSQIFVATTYPLDVVKAAQWVDASQEMPDGERADAALEEGWDPSVAALAAGFPDVVQRMADHVDWMEAMGEAVLNQTEDVLASVQRQRRRAEAAGNLQTNEAQTVVEDEDGALAIAPADPEVVYVPVYDTQQVYQTSTSYQPEAVAASDSGVDTGTVLAAGALGFVAGLVVAEVFNDDDDYWGGWWYPPRPPIGWGGGYVRPRPWGPGQQPNRVVRGSGNTVNVNIDNDGVWRPDRGRPGAGDRRPGFDDGDRRPGVGGRPGDGGGDRDALRQRLDTGADGRIRPADRAGQGDGQALRDRAGQGGGQALQERAGQGGGQALQERAAQGGGQALRDRAGQGGGQARPAAATRERPSPERVAEIRKRPGVKQSQGKPARGGGSIMRGAGGAPKPKRGGGGGGRLRR